MIRIQGAWVGRVFAAAAIGTLALWGTGCASSSESAGGDTLTSNVGKYDPPPSGAARPRVGVPPFSVQAGQGFSGGGDLNELAADQMTTLLDNSERFSVIERAQLQKLLDEQNLEGIVVPGEMAKSAQVRGVDYLLLGKVTNLRVKKEDKSRAFGLGQVGGLVNFGGADRPLRRSLCRWPRICRSSVSTRAEQFAAFARSIRASTKSRSRMT